MVDRFSFFLFFPFSLYDGLPSFLLLLPPFLDSFPPSPITHLTFPFFFPFFRFWFPPHLYSNISPRFSPSKPWVASLRRRAFSRAFSAARRSLSRASTASNSAGAKPAGGSSSLSRSISPSRSTFSPRTRKMPCALSAYRPLGCWSLASVVVVVANMRSVVDCRTRFANRREGDGARR